MELDLLWFQAGYLHRGLVITGLELGADPDVAAIRANDGKAVEGSMGAWARCDISCRV
jgi:hypothetical protein